MLLHGSRQLRSWLTFNVGQRMTDSLSIFKEWCQEAFRFLTEQLGFSVLEEAPEFNPYYVSFSRDDLKIAIRGEGYGSVGSVLYVTPTLRIRSQRLRGAWSWA